MAAGRFAVGLLLGVLAVQAVRAESTDCTTPVIVVADGRTTQSTFIQLATNWYGIYTQPGHSYSLEFLPPADNFVNGLRPQFVAISVYGPNDSLPGCRGASSVTVKDNSDHAPVISRNGAGAGRRVSFVAQSGGLYVVKAVNGGGTGSYTFRATDTTLFNLRWSTWGGYADQWGFLNRSDQPIYGVFYLFDANNNLVASASFTVPSGGEVVRGSYPNDLNLPGNRNGYALFSHYGPAGSIVADAYMISPTGLVVTYAKFEGEGHQ